MIFNKKELILIGSLTTLLIASFLVLSLVDNRSMTGYTAYTYQEVVDQRVGEYGDGFVGYVDNYVYKHDTYKFVVDGWAFNYDDPSTSVNIHLYFNGTPMNSNVADRPAWDSELGTWEPVLLNHGIRYIVSTNLESELQNLNLSFEELTLEEVNNLVKVYAEHPITNELQELRHHSLTDYESLESSESHWLFSIVS